MSRKQTTIYDYRRMKVLVDILAMETMQNNEWHCRKAIERLCHAWDVPIIVPLEEYGKEHPVLDWHATLQALAQHVLEHGRKESERNHE